MGDDEQKRISCIFNEILETQNFYDNDTERELSRVDTEDLFKPFTI
jgi:hypothetical protein